MQRLVLHVWDIHIRTSVPSCTPSRDTAPLFGRTIPARCQMACFCCACGQGGLSRVTKHQRIAAAPEGMSTASHVMSTPLYLLAAATRKGFSQHMGTLEQSMDWCKPGLDKRMALCIPSHAWLHPLLCCRCYSGPREAG